MIIIDNRIEKEKMKQEKGWEETVETLEQVKRINSTVEDIQQQRSKKGFISTVGGVVGGVVGGIKSLFN